MSLDFAAAVELKRLHSPRRKRWWRRTPRCAYCRRAWPCAIRTAAQEQITALLRAVIDANRGAHW